MNIGQGAVAMLCRWVSNCMSVTDSEIYSQMGLVALEREMRILSLLL